MGGGCKVIEPDSLTLFTFGLAGASLFAAAWWRQRTTWQRAALALVPVGLILSVQAVDIFLWIGRFDSGLWGGSVDYCATPAHSHLRSLRLRLWLMAGTLGALGVTGIALRRHRTPSLDGRRVLVALVMFAVGAGVGTPLTGLVLAGCVLLVVPDDTRGERALDTLAIVGLTTGLVLWQYCDALGVAVNALSLRATYRYRAVALGDLSMEALQAQVSLVLGGIALLQTLLPLTRATLKRAVLPHAVALASLATLAWTVGHLQGGMAFFAGPFQPDGTLGIERESSIRIPTIPSGTSLHMSRIALITRETEDPVTDTVWVADGSTPLVELQHRFAGAIRSSESSAAHLWFLVRLQPLSEGQALLTLSCTEGAVYPDDTPLTELLGASGTVRIDCSL